jgi:hypothetical protein
MIKLYKIIGLVIVSIMAVICIVYVLSSYQVSSSAAKGVAGIVTNTVTIYWDNAIANIQPLEVTVSETDTLTLYHVAELRGRTVYTSEITNVYTPGQLSVAGSGVFSEREFKFYGVEPGDYQLYARSWWAIGDYGLDANGNIITSVNLIYLDNQDEPMTPDGRGFYFIRSYTEPRYYYLPIVVKGTYEH